MILLKHKIALYFEAKKKVEKKKSLKHLGACAVESYLVPREVSNYTDDEESDGDFSDDDHD